MRGLKLAQKAICFFVIVSQIVFLLASSANFLIAQTIATTTETTTLDPIKLDPISIDNTTSLDQLQPTATVTQPINLTFVEALQPPISGDQYISVALNQEVDRVDFVVEGPSNANFSGIKKDLTHYYFIWPTAKFPNGYYSVKAIAVKGTVPTSGADLILDRGEGSFSVEVKNISATGNILPDTNVIENEKSAIITSEPIVITFVEALQPPLSKDQRVSVFLNQEADRVDFIVNGIRAEDFSGIKDDFTHYHFLWPVTKFPNGYYKVTAIVLKGAEKFYKSFSIEVKNNISNISNITPSPLPLKPIETTTTSNIINEPLIKQPFQELQPTNVNIECKEKGFLTPEQCQKYMAIPPDCRERGFSIKECQKYKALSPECRERNFSQEECQKFMAIPWECRQKNIFDPGECKKYIFRYSLPPECREAVVITQEECNKIIFLNRMPPECRDQGAKTKEECDKILNIQFRLTPECKDAKITVAEECDKLMMEKFLPPECRYQGAKTKEECDYILRNKYNNLKEATEIKVRVTSDEEKYFQEDKGISPECRYQGAKTKEECDKILFLKNRPPECQKENITTPEECERQMILSRMPSECRDAGIIGKEECEKFMFKKQAPKECLEAQIFTPQECEKFMFEKFAPADCRENGISNAEACKKFMFEKYGDKENILQDKFPIECQKAEAKTFQACEKIMAKAYLPSECQEQGITEPEKCDLYFQLKFMSPECREQSVRTQSECDKIMFKKFGPPECKEAGIENENECKEFMFNKYAPKVECRGLEEWQCKNWINEKHLGNIVAKQVQFAEIKERASQLIGGESIKVGELESAIGIAKELISLKEKETGLNIIAAEGKLILNESNNLIQTAPVVLMVDTDQDGLPDDMEKRFGTDPSKADTDGDGHSDTEELKKSYNPLGEGKLKEKLTSIDEVILNNKTLGQPKTDGIVSNNFIIKNISNLKNKETNSNNGYSFSGQAEPNSVITLYVYSDLPVVATVKVDEYGNWQYEFSQSLVDGEHEVYVALNDNTGKIITKSNPLNFFVKEAKAISVKDFVSTATAPAAKESEKIIYNYLVIAALSIIIGVLLYLFFIRQRKEKMLKT